MPSLALADCMTDDKPKCVAATPRRVFGFGGGTADDLPAGIDPLDLLGGKGAGLAEMSRLGLPVPPGFTLSTPVCREFRQDGGSHPGWLEDQVAHALEQVEALTESRFGNAAAPLLVAVRSGAAVSMPGMMDTVLNLGLNDVTVIGLAARSGDCRFAWDTYRRFIQMYGALVMGIDHDRFEQILESVKQRSSYRLDSDLKAEDCRILVREYQEMIVHELGRPFPQDVHEQLWQAIGAVFRSWNNRRAAFYRRLHGIPDEGGTAVTVQAMVLGNRGADSGTGVAFTRDPSTGENVLFGEFLPDAQGEDLVAGIRTPLPISRLAHVMPAVYADLEAVARRLEAHCRDMQDLEFTVQQGRLYLLQTRSGKRTIQAAVRIAVHMAEEGTITPEEAVAMVDMEALEHMLQPVIDPQAPRTLLALGLAAAPGAVTGKLAFSVADAQALAALGESVILCRTETDPEDIHGIHVARGILTARGGMTSHAAVVARGMGKTCVVGVADLVIDAGAGCAVIGGVAVGAGDVVTIDGSTGEVLLGAVPTIQPTLSDELAILIGWAGELRWLGCDSDRRRTV
jgi:pyruvate, orthophosphate dikinase